MVINQVTASLVAMGMFRPSSNRIDRSTIYWHPGRKSKPEFAAALKEKHSSNIHWWYKGIKPQWVGSFTKLHGPICVLCDDAKSLLPGEYCNLEIPEFLVKKPKAIEELHYNPEITVGLINDGDLPTIPRMDR